MAISINPLTFVIYVPKADLSLVQASPEVREIDLNWFRLQLKDLEDDPDLGIFLYKTHLHNTEVTLSGLTYARIVEVIDPYTVEFEDGQYTINCVGANHNLADVKVANQVSLIVNNAAGLINNAQIEYASFNGGVTVDETNGSAGTLFPIGTPFAPSNNWADALQIAAFRGITTFYVTGDSSITGSIDLSDYEIIGASPNKTTLTIDPTASTSGMELKNATVTGTLDGENFISDSVVVDLTYVNGSIINCGLIGDIELGGSEKAQINDCYTVDQDDPPVINMGGSGQSLAMPNYSGLLTLENLTDATQEIGVGINHGAVVILDTVTAGTVIVAGIGTCTDSLGNDIPTGVWNGGVNVNTDALISKGLISQAVWDEPIADHLTAETMGHQMYHDYYQNKVTINIVNGTSGTTFPTGSHENPVDNLADALTIAAAHNFKELHIQGSLTIDGEDITDYTLTADRSLGNTVTITSMVNTGACYFQDLTVSGALSGATRFTTCVLGNLTGFDGGAKNCLLTGDVTITGSGANYFTDCDTYVTAATITYQKISVGSNMLNIIRCRGAWEIADYTGSLAVTCDWVAGQIHVADTCVSGVIVLSGLVSLIDDSGPGCYVVDGTIKESGIADQVWEHTDGAALLLQVDDIQTNVDFIKDIEGGRWKIDSGQMIFYKDDNLTEVARFDITYDANLIPIERARV